MVEKDHTQGVPPGGVRIRLGEPVVVATSAVGERRWGYHQFVTISDYPGGRILLRFHAGEDAVAAYGTPAPTYLSADSGESWTPFSEAGLPPAGICAEMFDGEFVCVPPAKALNVETAGLSLPAPVGGFHSYVRNLYYRLADCPGPVKDYLETVEVARWSPSRGAWREDRMRYDTEGALVWTRASGPERHLVSRTWLERPPLRIGEELIYADYRSMYLAPDGSVPKNMGVTCVVSGDNGRSFVRRSTVAIDPEGEDALTEPMLAENANGELVCVIRRADHRQKGMLLTFSPDRGRTWERPTPFQAFGVFPCLLRLGCGVMIVSFGRPGVHLTFSPDGTGRTWTDPTCVLPGNPGKLSEKTDGYTSMLPMGDREALLAYTDFEHRDAEGRQRKAIVVRKVTVEL